MPPKHKLISQLCSEARDGKRLNPTACQTCISPCEYGKDWLRQMDMQPPEETRERPIYPKDIPRLSTTPKAISGRWYKNLMAQK